jgi:hypothetical protein
MARVRVAIVCAGLAVACHDGSDSTTTRDASPTDSIDANVDARVSDPSILRRPDATRAWSGVVTVIAALDAIQFRIDDATATLADATLHSMELDTRALSDGSHWLGVDLANADATKVETRWTTFTVANGAADPKPSFTGALVDVGVASGFSSVTSTPLPNDSVASAGAIAFDVDLDGAVDVVAWGTDGAAALYRSTARWTFTRTASIAGHVSAAGAADLDGDGDDDLVTAGDDVRLFRNDHGTLVDVTAAAGIASAPQGVYRGVTFADLDLDGLLDVLVARMDCRGGANLVLHDEGDLHFVDVASSLGLDHADGATYAFAADVDPDDDAMHVWTFHEGCRPTQTSHVTFAQTDALPTSSPSIALPEGIPVSPMGSAWIDADADGKLDLCASGDVISPVWRGPSFDANASPFVGLDAFAPAGGVVTSQWSMVLLDADFDGRWDVYTVHDPSDPSADSSSARDALYWQRTPAAFRDVAVDAGVDAGRRCRSAFGADLDADGDTDLLVGCRDGLRVLRNDLEGASAGSVIALHATTSPSNGVHAWARIGAGTLVMMRGGGQPYAGGVTLPSIPADVPIEVHWPSGIVQTVSASSAPRIDVSEPSLVRLGLRRVAPSAAPVSVTIDPSPLGAMASSVTIDIVGATWDAAPIAGSDGIVRASIHVPDTPTTVVLHVHIGGTPISIRPRLYVR